MRELAVLVVDDEPHARAGLASLVEKQPCCRLAGLAADGASAVRAIRAEHPDVVLLDVQMPGMNGFDVIGAVGTDQMPYVIFVTAHDEFAIEAFEHAALDYVLKPFKDARLVASLGRARAALENQHFGAIGQRLADVLGECGPRLDRFVVRLGDRVVVVPVEQVHWIQAANYCMRLHTGDQVFAIRQSMAQLEERLDPGTFIRVHRSAIVRRELITELRRSRMGDHTAILADGTRVPVGRNRWRAILDSCSGLVQR